MYKNTFLAILFISLMIFTLSLKENTPFEMHQQNPEDSDSAQKSHKKTRISEKEKFKLYDFFESLKDAFASIKELTTDFFNVFVLRKTKIAEKSSIIYRENFASQNGGAQILMVSSSKIKSPRAILRTDPDAYLFTADVLPITIVIALKQEILIDSFAIQSGEAYSCITNDFMLEGAFSLDNSEWIFMGNFTAQNSFETQEFAVQQKIIRYIRLTILSSYGKWKYFTLSQIKVYGEGLFSHAMESLLQTQYSIQSNLSSNGNENNTKQENIKKDTENTFTRKFGGKKVETRQILVQAFEGLVNEGNNLIKSPNDHNASSKQTSQNQFLADEMKNNDSQPVVQKSSSKDKKSISILKKKISYLEKRNFELNQELKNLRKTLELRLFELETRHSSQSGNKQEENGKWYNCLISSQSMVIISMIINISCLVLVGLVFKRKFFSSRMSQSIQLNNSQKIDQKATNEVQNKKDIKEKTTQKNVNHKRKSH